MVSLSVLTNLMGTVIPVVLAVLLFAVYDKRVFGYCICLMLMTALYNTLLKNIFQLPLPDTCHSQGFGFPSGHMHFAGIFYFWTFMHIRMVVIRVSLMLMAGFYGYLLIKLGYHYVIDVVGAWVFGILSSYCYRILIIKRPDMLKNLKLSLFIAYTMFVTLYFIGAMQTHVVMFLSVMIGFCLGIILFDKHIKWTEIKRQFLLLLTTFCILLSLLYLNDCKVLMWFTGGILVSSLPYIIRRLKGAVS